MPFNRCIGYQIIWYPSVSSRSHLIKIAWAVMILLYNWLSAMYCTPGPLSSIRISTENAVPNKPENNAKIK